MAKEFYSDKHKFILNPNERIKKAKKIAAVIMDFYGNDLNNLSCLDIGCSGGIITDYLAQYFKKVVGIDVDKNAIKFAIKDFRRKNLSFKVQDTAKLRFSDCSFDVVVCNHIYQYIKDKKNLLNEIHRVLKPNGFCYFAATTRFSHREMAFLSQNYLTYFGLRRLAKDFKIVDYSITVLKKDEDFYMRSVISGLLKKIPNIVMKITLPFFPSYIWILKKE